MSDELLEAIIQERMDAARQALMDFCLQDTQGPAISWMELEESPPYGSVRFEPVDWWKKND